MNVLALDTCAPVIGVALSAGGEVRERVERAQRGSETRLVPWALELCAEAGIALADLDGLAVARGPGSFTGVRVGLATAAGLAQALGVPVWATTSLYTRAMRARRDDEPVLPMLDARKGRVYAAWYPNPGSEVGHGPGDVPPEEAVAWSQAPFLATGEGALVYHEIVEQAGGILVPEADHPAVDRLATLGAEALRRGEGIDPVDLAPLYLRQPDARPPT